VQGRTTFWATLVATGAVSLALITGAQGAAERGSYASVQVACAGNGQKMRCYHRETRRRAGLPLLRDNRRLDRAALLKKKRIVRCRRITHEPCGEPFERPFRLAGYLPWPGSWIVGENLAWGWDTPWAAFQALMRSPTHRANILRRAFRELGVWQRRSPWGRFWVLEYGHRW
jgi:uncharacterized protein YkwD